MLIWHDYWFLDIWKSFMLTKLRYYVKWFQCWTSGDFRWPLTSSKFIMYLLLKNVYSNIMYGKDPSILPWHIVWTMLTSGDLRWSLTSTKTTKVLSLNMGHPHTNYEKDSCFLPWDIVLRRFSGFFTPIGLRWPLTSIRTNWILSYNKGHPPSGTFEKNPCFLP